MQLEEAYLRKLPEEPLRELSVKLLADLQAAHERLEQNSSNSSRPPSSELLWQGKPKEEENEEGTKQSGEGGNGQGARDRHEEKQSRGDEQARGEAGAAPKPPRRAGQQPGAPGHGRTQSLPIDQEEHHHPGQCAGCGAALGEGNADRIHSASLAIDLREPSGESAGLEVIQTKHIYHESQCDCGHWTRAEPGHCDGDEQWWVALSERHLVGPLLIALLCALPLRMRLSRRRIQEFLGDWLGLQFRVATINQCLHEAARALEPVLEEQLVAEVRNSALLHGDKTSWKEHGRLLWLWVFSTATTSVFVIGKRSQEFLYSVLGSILSGWLMSDGYWAYRDYENRLRCLTHLLRKARGLEESFDRQAQEFGKTLRTCIEAVMKAVYVAREGPPAMALREQFAAQLLVLLDLCIASPTVRRFRRRQRPPPRRLVRRLGVRVRAGKRLGRSKFAFIRRRAGCRGPARRPRKAECGRGHYL